MVEKVIFYLMKHAYNCFPKNDIDITANKKTIDYGFIIIGNLKKSL